MNVPDWWALALLVLAAYRIFRLLAEDTILDAPRAWLVGLPRDWKEGDRVPSSYRDRLADFLSCPWCLGFWIVLAWWGAWQLWPHATLVAAALFAISTGVGLIARIGGE